MTIRHDSEVARVYDRVAGIYDLYTAPMEALGGTKARQRLFSRARGRVLELGIGTGLSLPYYPDDVELTGVDISPRMVDRARRRATRLNRQIDLQVADIERLPYADATFDTVAAACVFCSVRDPVQGLREARRVTTPDGQILLYEHVRPTNRFLGWVADLVSPLTRRAFGPELNRQTEEYVAAVGLVITDIRRANIWREIVARTPELA